MKKVAPDYPIKLAANDGSQFFFIGTASELEEKAAELEKTSAEAIAVKVNNTVKAISETLKSLGENLKKHKKDPKQSKHLAQEALKKVKSINKRLIKLCDTEEIFFPLMDRKITDIFKADPIVDESIVVYVDGIEVGSMWFVGCTDTRAAEGSLSKA